MRVVKRVVEFPPGFSFVRGEALAARSGVAREAVGPNERLAASGTSQYVPHLFILKVFPFPSSTEVFFPECVVRT